MRRANPAFRVTSGGLAAIGRLTALLLAGFAVGGLIGACGSGGAGTTARSAADPTTAGTSDPPPGNTTSSTETKTVTEPARTVTRTETVEKSPPTNSVANSTTSVQVSPTSTTGEQTGDDIPSWGWVLIGLGIAAVAVGIFAAGHHRGARKTGGPGVSAPPT